MGTRDPKVIRSERIRQLSFCTTQRGDQPQFAPTPSQGAKKRFAAPIRRPGRASILCRICGQPMRRAGIDQLDIDIEVVLLLGCRL